MSGTPLPPTVGLILHFRHAAHTAACLDSLAGEGVRRMLVVDNSEDAGASLRALGPTLDTLAAAGVEIALCEPGRNLGFSAGVNRGLAEIHARHGRACVLLINNDARLQPGAHARLRQALADGRGLSVPRMHTSVGPTIDSVFYHRSTGLLLRRRWPGSYEYLSGCCVLLGPELAAEPLFDEDFFFYGDDAELGWRLLRRRVPQHKVPEALVEHDPSTGSRNGSLFYEYHMVRAHWLLARKLAGSHLGWMVNLLGRAVFLPLRALLRATRQRSLAPLRGGLMATLDVLRGRCRALTPRI